MFKLTEAADLEKAGRSLANFFAKGAEDLEKDHSFHKAMATHHSTMAGHHDSLAKAHSAAHASMDDDNEVKACMGKAAGEHGGLCKAHNDAATTHHAEAEATKAKLDTMKAFAAEWGGVANKAAAIVASGAGLEVDLANAGTSVDDMLKATSQALMKQTLTTFQTDPDVKDAIRQLCLKQIGGILGDKLVPDQISGVLPEFPGVRMVTRAGQPKAPEKPNVPLEFEKLVSIDDEEQ